MPIRENALHLSNELITLNELKILLVLSCLEKKRAAGRDEGDLGDKTWECWSLAENRRKQLEAVGCESEVVVFGLPLADAAPQFFFP